MRNRMPSLLAALLLSARACAVATRAPANQATVIVHNPSLRTIEVQLCGPLACSGYRPLRAGRTSRFHYDTSRGERAVVTARLRSRILDQQPVDAGAGEAARVTLNVS
jgi:transposase